MTTDLPALTEASVPEAVTAPSEGPRPEVQQRVLRQFRQLFSAVRRHFQTMEKLSGIGGAQVWALSLIAHSPGIGVNRLASVMDVHQSTTSNLVRSLVERGLVHSERSERDRRSVELYVLPEGQKILRKVPGPYAGVLPSALSRLDADTLLALERHLATLIGQIDVDDRAARQPLATM